MSGGFSGWSIPASWSLCCWISSWSFKLLPHCVGVSSEIKRKLSIYETVSISITVIFVSNRFRKKCFIYWDHLANLERYRFWLMVFHLSHNQYELYTCSRMILIQINFRIWNTDFFLLHSVSAIYIFPRDMKELTWFRSLGLLLGEQIIKLLTGFSCFSFFSLPLLWTSHLVVKINQKLFHISCADM